MRARRKRVIVARLLEEQESKLKDFDRHLTDKINMARAARSLHYLLRSLFVHEFARRGEQDMSLLPVYVNLRCIDVTTGQFFQASACSQMPAALSWLMRACLFRHIVILHDNPLLNSQEKTLHGIGEKHYHECSERYETVYTYVRRCVSECAQRVC